MNQVTNIFILIITLVSCKTKSTEITEGYLENKKYVKPAIMGGKTLEFTNSNKVRFVIKDKRDFGYNATYSLITKDGKQYISINDIEEFGENILNKNYKEEIIEIKNPTEIIYSGVILKLVE